MNFNNRNFNPNIWDTPRPNIPPPFVNNQQNFFGNNNFPPRQNFPPQQQQGNPIRPLLSLPVGPPPNETPNFRKFNNNQDFQRNSRGGRNNFQK